MSYPDLPASWRLAIRSCPYCAHSPGKTDDGKECIHCQGTGDLMGQLLLDAYSRGRADMIEGLSQVDAVRKHAIERLLSEQPTGITLKRAMGL